MLCEFCEAVKRGAGLPKSPQLKKEMTALSYFFQNGKKRVIEKEQVKAIIKCSPDECDAYALTYAMPDKPRNVGIGGLKIRKAQEYGSPRDYNPVEGVEPEERRMPL
jgi:hypothetical protein